MELNQPADQTIAVEARFNLTRDAEVGMRELRAIRARMWDENPMYLAKFPHQTQNTRLQDVARMAGLDTKDKYVNAVQLDQGYSAIALQRAVEAAVLFDHKRPYNGTCTAVSGTCGDEGSATINGRGGFGQNLHSEGDINVAMRGWGDGEVRALKATGGEWSSRKTAMNGHLHNFLNPWITRVGFASVVTAEGEASAATLGWNGTGVATFPEGQRAEVLTRPAASNETPSSTPKKFGVLDGGSSSDLKSVIGIIVAVVSLISVLASVGQQFLKF